MADRERDQVYSEKEYCIIAGEDEFEPVDIAGYGQTIYRRKHDDINDHQKQLQRPPAEQLYHFQNVNWLFPVHDEWRAHLIKNRRSYEQAKPVIFPSPANTKLDQLTISASQLGATLVLMFGMFIVVSVVTHQWLIHPLVGWIGIVFGLTFMLMGRVQKSSDSTT